MLPYIFIDVLVQDEYDIFVITQALGVAEEECLKQRYHTNVPAL